MSLFSLLIPTRQRVDLINRLFQSIVNTTASTENLEIILGIDNDDNGSKAISHDVLQIKKVILPAGATMGALNRACFDASSGRYVMLMNDDVILRTKNWDKILYSTASLYKDDIVLIHVNDLLFREKLCTFPILSRKACLQIGICPSQYRRYRIDDHIYDVYNLLARLGHKRIVYLPDVIFEHTNYTAVGKRYQTHLFTSLERRVYIPNEEIIEVDAQIFDEKLNERKDAAIKLARLIDKSRYERLVGSQTSLNHSILADIRDPYSYRECDFVRTITYPTIYSEQLVRTTIAIVSSDIRKEHGQKCLSSIKEHTSNYDLIILDNSADKDFSHPREINRIFRTAQSDFLVIIDDDVFVEPGWLDGLLRCMDDETGVVVPMHKDKNGVLSFSGVYLAGDGRGTHGHTVDKPDFSRGMQCYSSALLLIDMRKCGEIFMDEAYQKYFFDLVHSLQVWESGFKAVCTPDVAVTHLGGATLTYGSTKAKEIWKRDCAIFVKDWVNTGRLAKIERQIWQKDPYLKALSETPQRIHQVFDNIGQLTLSEFEDEVKELIVASRNYNLFKDLIIQRLYWCMPVLAKKLVAHGVRQGISLFQTGEAKHARRSGSGELSGWQRLKFYLLLVGQTITMIALRPVGKAIRKLIGARKYNELKIRWNSLIFSKQIKS